MNRTGNDTSATDDYLPFQIVANVIQTLTTLLILVLNPLSLVVLRRAGGIQQTTKILMASMTVSDTCSGVVLAAQLSASLSGKWVLGEFPCSLFMILSPIFMSVNAQSLVLLTIDRYIAIVRSLRYATLMTTKRAKIFVALVWSWATAQNLVLLVIKTQMKEQLEGDNLCLAVQCTACYLVYNLGFVISCLVVLVLYLHILKVAHGHARRIAAQNHVGGRHQGQNAPERISTKSATTVLIITAAVCVSWAAPILLNIYLYKGVFDTRHPVYTFGVTIYFTNSWLNVVIYYWRNKELRQALRSLIASSCR